MKRFILLLLILVSTTLKSSAQIADVKLNIATAAFAIFNPSIELGFNTNSAITMDYMGAYAKENYLGTGRSFLYSMATFGYRHYLLNENHDGLFVGGDLSLSNFRMNKSIIQILNDEYSKNKYDVGHATILGFTAGYKLPIKSSRWLVECSASFGWQHAWHEGYRVGDNGVELIEPMSKSGEWLPYKAGIYLTYRLFE